MLRFVAIIIWASQPGQLSAQGMGVSQLLTQFSQLSLADSISQLDGVRLAEARVRKEHITYTQKIGVRRFRNPLSADEITRGVEEYTRWLASLQGSECEGCEVKVVNCPSEDSQSAMAFAHILCTKHYRAECLKLFRGFFLHRSQGQAFFKRPLSQIAAPGHDAGLGSEHCMDTAQFLGASSCPQVPDGTKYSGAILAPRSSAARAACVTSMHAQMSAMPGLLAAAAQVAKDWGNTVGGDPDARIYADDKKTLSLRERHESGKLLQEYQRWWILRKSFPDFAFPMLSDDVDDFWHAHMSTDTEAYERECAEFFPLGFGAEGAASPTEGSAETSLQKSHPIIPRHTPYGGLTSPNALGFLHHTPYGGLTEAETKNNFADGVARFQDMKALYTWTFQQVDMPWFDAQKFVAAAQQARSSKL